MSITELYHKHKDVVPYLFFGVCTTLVNMVVYYVMAHILKADVTVSTVAAWIAAVLFAYLTNRVWVFHSEAHTVKEIGKEILSFFSCRLATGFVDWGCMAFFAGYLGMNDMIIKFLANVLVIVLNYIASKLVIFRKRS